MKLPHIWKHQSQLVEFMYDIVINCGNYLDKELLMYNVKSPKAEEFINHDEIMDTLAYAKENTKNRKLQEEILEKGRKM